jgi:hypothetical protein
MIRPWAQASPNHSSRAGAGYGPGRGHRDILDGGEAAFLLRALDCLIPAVVPLTF